MTAFALRQRIGIVIAVAALCAAVAGCISYIGATTSEKADEGSVALLRRPEISDVVGPVGVQITTTAVGLAP